GNDTLNASDVYSADTYVFNLGDGQDTLTEWGNGPANGYSTTYNDTISFGAGIAASSVQLIRVGTDLIFRINETDQITVKHWFLDTRRYIERITFADGTVWNETSLRAQVPAIFDATSESETVNGWNGIDLINGLAGDDILNGYDQNDTL